MEKYKAALETMCKRCENYDMCQGTGCGPKKDLAEAIKALENQETDITDKIVKRLRDEAYEEATFEYQDYKVIDLQDAIEIVKGAIDG